MFIHMIRVWLFWMSPLPWSFTDNTLHTSMCTVIYIASFIKGWWPISNLVIILYYMDNSDWSYCLQINVCGQRIPNPQWTRSFLTHILLLILHDSVITTKWQVLFNSLIPSSSEKIVMLSGKSDMTLLQAITLINW